VLLRVLQVLLVWRRVPSLNQSLPVSTHSCCRCSSCRGSLLLLLLQLLLLVLQRLLRDQELALHFVVAADGGGQETLHVVEAVLLVVHPLGLGVVLQDLWVFGRQIKRDQDHISRYRHRMQSDRMICGV
jgi:hypothetical protein